MPQLSAPIQIPATAGVDTPYQVRCTVCGQGVSLMPYRIDCPSCGGTLDFSYPDKSWRLVGSGHSIWRYRRRLPVDPLTEIVSMGEGGTPQLRAESQPDFELFLKNETTNPTGSHKDRALSIGITKAREFGFDTCMLYSDGSAPLSSAAYAARAGMLNIALVPRGTSSNRLLPLLAYSSVVLEFAGDAADALDWVHEACQSLGIYETSTYRKANPYESEGPKTISYEIFEDLVADGFGTFRLVWIGLAIGRCLVDPERLAGFVDPIQRIGGVTGKFKHHGVVDHQGKECR